MNEIKHFIADTSTTEQAYGYTWNQVVMEYLKAKYKDESAQSEIEVHGKIYKVLKRGEVTAFYDEKGNTLFDVTEERLAQEYEWYEVTNGEEATEPSQLGKVIESIEHEAFENATAKDTEEEDTVYMGTTSLGDIVTGNVPAPTPEEIAAAKEAQAQLEDGGEESGEDSEEEEPKQEEQPEETDNKSVYVGIVGAVTKLQEELKSAKDKRFAEPVIEYLIDRCKKSESLADDVCQDHKTWKKCYDYIYETARKELKGVSGPVGSDTVFEWAEDYFHRDDKAEEEKKAKAEEEKKKKAAEKKKSEQKVEKKEVVPKPAPNPATEPKTTPKPKEEKQKKSGKDMDGQMDIFSFMGM